MLQLSFRVDIDSLAYGCKLTIYHTAGELESALKRAESHSWSDSAGVESAVTSAVEEVSRTVKISKQAQAAGRADTRHIQK